MSVKMWKIPASDMFVKHIAITGWPQVIPDFEHKYLGRQLTSKDTSATLVDVDENMFRITLSVVVENRKFSYNTTTNTWYVPVDKK